MEHGYKATRLALHYWLFSSRAMEHGYKASLTEDYDRYHKYTIWIQYSDTDTVLDIEYPNSDTDRSKPLC
jgi:hypothetical protein